jgi:hypothetical protein
VVVQNQRHSQRTHTFSDLRLFLAVVNVLRYISSKAAIDCFGDLSIKLHFLDHGLSGTLY